MTGGDGMTGGEGVASSSSGLQPQSSSIFSRVFFALRLSFLQRLSPLLSFAVKYRDVLQRVAVTIAMLAILRLGMFVPLPGVDMALMQPTAEATEGEAASNSAGSRWTMLMQ